MNANTTNTPKLAHPVAPLVQKTSSADSPPLPTALAGVQPPVADAAQAKWASRINQRVRKGLEAFIEAGKDLIAAKKALGHGGFGAMLKSGLLIIDQRTAERLMRVAGNPALSNSTNWSILPQRIQSLDKLAALDAPVIEQAIAAGEITPTMTIADAGELVRSKQPGQAKSVTKKPESAAAPKSPAVVERHTSATVALFDVEAFKTALTQFLEREYAKVPPACAVEMQSAAAAACSEFFASLTATPSQSTGQIRSVLHVDGTSEADDVALPPSEAQEVSRDGNPAAAKNSGTTTPSSVTGDAVPIFRKNYPLSDDERSRLVQDLATLKSTEPVSSEYRDALRRVVDAGHYLAVAGSLDAFCVEFLRRDAVEVKLLLEGQQAKAKAKQLEQSPPAPAKKGVTRALPLRIALKNSGSVSDCMTPMVN